MSRLAWWSINITHWFCQRFKSFNLFPDRSLFVQCFLCRMWSLFRVLIKVFLPYNISNINKICKISLANKELSSIPFTSSTSNSFILHEVEKRQFYFYVFSFSFISFFLLFPADDNTGCHIYISACPYLIITLLLENSPMKTHVLIG